MINIAIIVDRAIRAQGIPIDGVAIGDPATRATWIAQFTAAATPAQKTQAAGIIASVAVDAAAQNAEDQKDAQAFVDSLPIWAKALVLALIDELNILRALHSLAARTPAQAIAAMRAKAGTL